MNIRPLHPFREVAVISPPVFSDQRGTFREIFHRARHSDAGLRLDVVQINHSHSARAVLRGLHFQHPTGQGKLVAVTAGAVFDVAVDVRVGSPTFGQWASQELTADGGEQLYVPPGFAHGFLVLSDSADVVYGCTDFHRPDAERVLAWDDAAVGVLWPLDQAPVMAARDRAGSTLASLESAGHLPRYAT